MECVNCGASINETMKFCPNCGSTINVPSASSKATKNFQRNAGETTQTPAPNIQIQIEANHDHAEGYRECPKCDAIIPLSSITLARDRPTLKQWIGAIFLGYFIYATFDKRVSGGTPMYARVFLTGVFVLLFLLLLRRMFTRKKWICPACHKVNKIKQN